MKKFLVFAALLILVLALATGCATKDEVLKVGASITPHAEILKQVVEPLAKEGITLEIIEFTDYVQPNTAVESGDLDANYFQHIPYMEQFNADNGTHLVAVANIHYEPLGIYAGRTKSLADLKDGAIIGVPNDGTNEARALFLLEDNGLIKLKEGADLSATVLDIAENPKNLVIKELEAAQVPLSLPDLDLGVINGNYALQANLKASVDALALEDANSIAATTYPNIICVKEGHEKDPAIQKLVAALQTAAVRDYINETFDGVVVPLF